jgi:hypothetical protein
MKPEVKLWHELKRNTSKIIWTRLENRALFGTPDLLGYPVSGNFFTLELKVTKGNKIIFSPHQISFHMKHKSGLKLEPLREGWQACCLKLESL